MIHLKYYQMMISSILLSTSHAWRSTLPRTSTTILRMSTGSSSKKGKVLVLGGNGYLGSNVANRAILEGYEVTSLSRRGVGEDKNVQYRKGDARDQSEIANVLSEGDYVAVVHCIGLLFDSASGIGKYNRLVSGSGSIPDENSTYDNITRLTAFNAIQATEDYATSTQKRIPFIFTSAAEANWPNVSGGSFIENNLSPKWLQRYLKAKRAVEQRLMQSSGLRPVIFRPSLIYSFDKMAALPAVFAFVVGNKVGLPFVDRPVTVQNLSMAVVKAIEDEGVEGVQGYKEIDELSSL